MTWKEHAKSVAAEHGRAITDEEADWLLWEWTAFPCGGMDIVTAQLRDLFAPGPMPIPLESELSQ